MPDHRRTETDLRARGTGDVNAIKADPNALGFFGYAYYLANADSLNGVAIDSGLGCVKPSAEAVVDATYQPLSRPLFIYVAANGLTRPEVKAFARSYINPANTARIRELGYIPLPTAALLVINRRLESGATGSLFGGRGAVLGITADVFEDLDRIQNAIVR